MKGQLPKAYLRIDPNLDQTHPDPGSFIRLLCAAARQPKRGRFKARAVAEQALGKKRVAAFLDRHDLIERAGVLEVDGWDIWQEGDFTVGERMRRFRERHQGVTDTVTEGVTAPSPPSEAVRQQGVKERSTELAPSISVQSMPEGEGVGGGGAEKREFAEAIWEAWRKKRGGGSFVISAAEYTLVDQCWSEDVPLRIVLRGIQDCAGKPTPKTPLTYARGAVKDAIAHWVQSQTA